MHQIVRIDCWSRPAKGKQNPDYISVEREADRVYVRRRDSKGQPKTTQPTLDFPFTQTALAVQIANMLAGAKP